MFHISKLVTRLTCGVRTSDGVTFTAVGANGRHCERVKWSRSQTVHGYLCRCVWVIHWVADKTVAWRRHCWRPSERQRSACWAHELTLSFNSWYWNRQPQTQTSIYLCSEEQQYLPVEEKRLTQIETTKYTFEVRRLHFQPLVLEQMSSFSCIVLSSPSMWHSVQCRVLSNINHFLISPVILVGWLLPSDLNSREISWTSTSFIFRKYFILEMSSNCYRVALSPSSSSSSSFFMWLK